MKMCVDVINSLKMRGEKRREEKAVRKVAKKSQSENAWGEKAGRKGGKKRR
jgi:hypothetical protein